MWSSACSGRGTRIGSAAGTTTLSARRRRCIEMERLDRSRQHPVQLDDDPVGPPDANMEMVRTVPCLDGLRAGDAETLAAERAHGPVDLVGGEQQVDVSEVALGGLAIHRGREAGTLQHDRMDPRGVQDGEDAVASELHGRGTAATATQPVAEQRAGGARAAAGSNAGQRGEREPEDTVAIGEVDESLAGRSVVEDTQPRVVGAAMPSRRHSETSNGPSSRAVRRGFHSCFGMAMPRRGVAPTTLLRRCHSCPHAVARQR